MSAGRSVTTQWHAKKADHAKLAAYEANRDRVDKLRDLNRDVLEGKEGAVSDVGAVTTGAELVAARVVLTDSDIANAKRVLLRQPQTRRTEHVKELVQWLRASDLFYGLSKSERTDLMMGVTGRLVAEHDVIVSTGDSHPKVHVVVTGGCEMYHFVGGAPGETGVTVELASAASGFAGTIASGSKTVNPPKGRTALSLVSEGNRIDDPDSETTESLKAKSRPNPTKAGPAMGRRATLYGGQSARGAGAVRSGAGAKNWKEKAGTALGKVGPNSSRMERRRCSMLVANERRSQQEALPKLPQPKGLVLAGGVDGAGSMVRLTFGPKESFGQEVAFANVQVANEGTESNGVWMHASHTVVATEETLLMTFSEREHIEMLRKAYAAHFSQKVAELKSCSSFGSCSLASIQAMASRAIRCWAHEGDVVAAEGGLSDQVYFCVKGQCKVVIHIGTAQVSPTSEPAFPATPRKIKMHTLCVHI